MRYQSDMERVLGDLIRDIGNAETNLEISLRQAGIDASALIVYRIQIKGEGSNGQRLVSRSAKRTGAYSKAYGIGRLSRGRQVDHIDFTNQGDLMRSFVVLQITQRFVTIGFLNDDQADKAEYLESYFGEAFSLTDEEEELAIKGLIESFFEDLER